MDQPSEHASSHRAFNNLCANSQPRQVAVIGVACGAGASDAGCADAPDALRTMGLLDALDLPSCRLDWEDTIYPGAGVLDKIAIVTSVSTQLAGRVQEDLIQGRFPLVIGGDHSIAIGTWSGAHAAQGEGERLGLVWIDAHLDSHTFATTPSLAIHGMPLACLLGHGERELTHIAGPSPKVRPEDVCVIGVRSYEQEEMSLLKMLGVRIYCMPEIRKRGFAEVLMEAVGIVKRKTAGFGISFDIDAFDPSVAAGTGTPVAGGLMREEVLPALVSWHDDPCLLALEIVEYNPHRDIEFATAGAVRDLCRAFFG